MSVIAAKWIRSASCNSFSRFLIQSLREETRTLANFRFWRSYFAATRISPRANRLPRWPQAGSFVISLGAIINGQTDTPTIPHTTPFLIYTRRGDALCYGLRRFTLRLKFNWNIKNFNGGRGVKTIALLSTEDDDRINNELRRFLFLRMRIVIGMIHAEVSKPGWKEIRDSFTVIRIICPL